jgi:hypothetical protein
LSCGASLAILPRVPSSSTRKQAQAGPRRQLAGIGLPEIMLLLGVVATGIAAGLPAFVRALRLSKVSEASEQLAHMQKGVAGYYAGTHETEAGIRHGCIPNAAGPTPTEPSPDAQNVDFADATVEGAATWQAVGFAPEVALRFRYTLSPSEPGCSEPGLPDEGRSVVLRAEGDLDGDRQYSLFERTLQTTRAGLAVEPVLLTLDRIE